MAIPGDAQQQVDGKAAMTLSVGSVLEHRYRIEQRLGQGGMGAVYRAYDTRLQQTVAIKENIVAAPGILPEAVEAARRQFEQEALMLARVRHPNLPRVSDHFVTPEGDQYLVMDYIEGQDLAHIIARNGPLLESQALAWIGQVCNALEYLHSQQPPIIHRDIKPQNIKVTPNGQVYLVDFGIAKLGGMESHTTAGALSVTPGFSPPEQYAMTGTDARTDIYALGATLYALLTGQVPPDSISLQSGEAQLVPPRQVNAAISPDLQQAVLKAMEARRTDRPQTVAEFRRMLTPQRIEKTDTVTLPATLAMGEGRSVSDDTPASPQPARPSRPWVWVLAGTGVVALIMIIVAVLSRTNANPAATPGLLIAQATETSFPPTARPTETTVPPTARPTETTAPPTARPTELLAIPNPPKAPEQVDAIDLAGKIITVTFWHERSQRDQNLLQAMLDEFNKTNKYGITARAEIVGTTYSDVYKKVNATLLAGQPPEMSVAFQYQAAAYRSSGVVVDLAPFIESKKYGLSQEDFYDYFEVFFDGDANPQFKGEQLGFPLQRSMDVLYYNVDWLRQLGYDGPPKDWLQFEEMACKAVNKNKTGWAYHHDVSNFAALVFARGGRILSADGDSYVFNSDASVDAVKMIQRMFEKGCAVEVPVSEFFGEETRFGKGQVLFVFGASSALPFYADAVNKGGKFQWDIAMPPNNGKPAVNLYGASISIHKTTPEQELAAWLAIKFLGEKAQTAKWAAQTAYLPVRQSAKTDVTSAFKAQSRWGAAADMYARLFDWIPYSMTESPAAGYDSVRVLIDRDILSKVIANPQADVKALLDAGVKRANEILKANAPK